MADINDLLNFAGAEQPTKFASAFDEIMGQKIADSMDDVRVSVAQGMFASEEPDEDLEDEDFDFDDEDVLDDDDDDDLDDIDWDDEDFDLDEDDLEGLEDDEDA